MLNVENWAEIRRLHHSEKLSINEIVRRTGAARNTVRAALRSDVPPDYKRKPSGSIVDEVELQIRELLGAHPRMATTVVAERIGWQRGITVLKERVAELRPLYLPPDPCQRTNYSPGELAQWDLWFPPADIPLGYGQVGSPPVIVGVLGYSRVVAACMIPSRTVHDILSGHLACLVDFGGVPHKGVYDGEAALSSRHGAKVNLSEEFQCFRGTLGMGVVICKPGDPEAKGLVERANGYLETSFLPGRAFSDPHDFNTQLKAWLPKANSRNHRTLGCRPVDRLNADRAAMMTLPPIVPDTSWRFGMRLARDHYVRVATCDYSVHPRAVGRLCDVRVDLDSVVVTCGGHEVARHRRLWAKHQTVTDPVHAAARRAMTPASSEPSRSDDVEIRDLGVYDLAAGVAS